ncbi:MAG TPA: OmpA family protein [Candidatus Nanoarchaeia archaeon]|nr:OmpA family protein [Candidatus Nanoarchaeia archaeon]
MNRIALLATASVLSLGLTVGCATKNTVRKEVQPTINKVNELDDLTARTTREIRDVDQRSQQGIQTASAKADEANQKALAAGRSAEEAQTLASQAQTRVVSLTNQVVNLDNYRPVVETSVHFGFDKSDLTKKAKQALDQLGSEIQNAKGYIVVVDGNADAVGPADYNYRLSQRRADMVIQYLAAQHNVPAHKVFVIGLGEDRPADSNRTAEGRAKNRRVDVRLMTNVVDQSPATAAQNQPQQ